MDTLGQEVSASRVEARTALLNALKLGASLLLTWTIALAARFVLPRYLGPEQFGTYTFSEGLAATFFVFAHLGIDTYVQKEIPLRTAHASDFFAGLLLVRVALAAVLLAAMMGLLELTGRGPEVKWVAALFGVGQLFFVTNGTASALLHARASVDGLSLTNVVTKVGWAAGVVAALSAGYGLSGAAAAFALAEGVRAVTLVALCRRHLALRLTVSPAWALKVVKWSLPFFLTIVASTLYSRLDVTMVAFLAGDLEAGWYALANNVAQLGLLFTPLIASVLLPLFTRARARSDQELDALLGRSMQLIVALAAPVSLFLSLGAETWVGLVGGSAFLPATASLRIIAPMFTVTYVAILTASCLNLLNQAWTVTRACLAGLALHATLTFALVPPFERWLGPGGAGAGAALAAVVTEVVVTLLMLRRVASRVLSATTRRMLVATGSVCGAVALLDIALRPLGPVRLAIDVVLYVGLAIVTRAIDVRDLWAFVQDARSARRAP